jgi:hypothetical protein|tara:strand:+ start:99 stop:1274 length:1176 start_codon:yes stop_codon:yes gene_type:complete
MGIFDKIADIAEKTARPARNIAIGYLTEKIENTRAADAQNAAFIQAATEQYFNVDKPQFIKEEKERDARIKRISATLTPVYANYADANQFTLSDRATNQFLAQIQDLSKEDQFKLESTIIDRKKERVQSFDEKNKFVKDRFKNLPGGPGGMNLMDVFFPDEGKDIADVGVKQDMAQVADEPMKSIMQIQGGGTGTYNIKDYGTERREFDTDFRSTFRNPISGAPEINVGPSDARYELQQFLKEGYLEAKKAGYQSGEFQYMLNKYIDTQFKNQGITGYPTGFPETTKEQTLATASSADTEAVPGDGKKFDTPAASKVDVGEDTKVTTEIPSGASGSSAAVINDFREFRAKINDSPSLSEDEKIKKIEQAKERVKQRLTELGTFNESVLRQL